MTGSEVDLSQRTGGTATGATHRSTSFVLDLRGVTPTVQKALTPMPDGAAIASLASDDASSVNGVDLVVDGGQTAVP